jgi:putative endonuclease
VADPRHTLGRAAEHAVATWLAAHDWEILEERHRSDAGEIDLVALDSHQCLVAVEVRLRRSARAGSPLESVSPRHLSRVRAALTAYARGSSVRHAGTRVDLVSLMPADEPGTWRMTRLPAIDAW